MTPDFLDHVLTTLRREGFEVIPVDALAERLAAPARRRPFAVLTFDDGYRDNILHAQPILRRHGAHWALFVTEAFAAGTGRLWWRELEYAITRLARLPRPGGGPEIDAETPAARGGHSHASVGSCWRERGCAPVVDRALGGLGGHRRRPDRTRPLRGMGGAGEPRRGPLGDPWLAHAQPSRPGPAHGRVLRRRDRPQPHGPRGEAGAPHPPSRLSHGGGSDAGAREYEVAGVSGYATAMTTRPGHLSHRHAQSLTALPRISMNGLHQSDAALRSLLSGVPFLPARLAGGTGRRSRPQNRPGAFA